MFRQEIQLIAPERRIYIDESGVDEDIYRPYARKKRGERVYCDISGKKKQRISIIAAYSEKSLKAPFRFEGYTNTLVFNTWIEECLVPELEEGQVIIIDNASFHKSIKTKELIEGAGCKILFLPAYSPDLNKIEPQWANLKDRMRKYKTPEQSLTQILDQELYNMSSCKVN